MENKREKVYSHRGFDWDRLLGAEVAHTMDEERNRELYQKMVEQRETQLDALYRLFDAVIESTVQKEVSVEFPMEFPSFYGWFFSVALSYVEMHFPKLFDVCEDVGSVLFRNVYEAVKMLPVRCLIQEIHHCKEVGKLEGTTPREEYRFYDSHMLGDIAYVREICQKYPELLRLMLVKIDWTVRELAHIAMAVENDRKEIQTVFCAGSSFSKIRKIRCALSDTHRQGRTVAQVTLDNGVRILYKPRSLQKECDYQRAYDWLGQRMGITTYHLKVIRRADYGWEEWIEREECTSPAAVSRYFYRLGMQLCLCYLVNGSDLHGENIIAKGEFPVIIDMETFSGNQRKSREDIGEDMGGDVRAESTRASHAPRRQSINIENERRRALRDFLQDDVLRTGILPVPVWGGQGEKSVERGAVAGGVNVSALHKAGKITAPFRLPAIEHAGTSDIAVAYRQGELELPDSLPYLRGKPVHVTEYHRELVAGFVDAYRCVSGNASEKTLEELLFPLWWSESRYVMRHTQQYSMYLFTSLHPDFMRSTESRIRFLHVLRKAGTGGSSDDGGRETFWQELRDMVNMDIPYFSCKGASLSLFASDGTEISRFFAATALEEGKRKLERLGEADLQKQLMLISYSLLMLGEEGAIAPWPRTVGYKEEAGCEDGRRGCADGVGVNDGMAVTTASTHTESVRPVSEERRLAAVRGIAQTIYRLRLDGGDKERGKDVARRQVRDVGLDTACGAFWPDLQFYGDGGWGIRSLSMDLYDGLPGVALFFAELSEKIADASEREDYEQTFSWLCGQLFDYTDSQIDFAEKGGVREDGGMTEADGMGLFVGESSLWYAYLLLWEIKKNPEFLEYAGKQERIVRKRRGATNEVDLLAGDAGCILCYLKMYECVAQYEKMHESAVLYEKMHESAVLYGKGHERVMQSKSGTVCLAQTELPDKQEYLAIAVEVGEVLWERVEEQKIGCGWTIQGENVPLAGMAHGNSGGICAYAGLLGWTRNSIYVERIRKLVEYEDALYSDALGNWMDVRKQHARGGEKRNLIAWCHGAAGILLSRLKLYSLPEFQNDALVKQDIERAVAALKYGEIPNNICLCHGLAGNYIIIRKCLELFPDEELEKRGEMLLSMLISQLEEDEYMTAQERNRVGLMCGLAGAGMALV